MGGVANPHDAGHVNWASLFTAVIGDDALRRGPRLLREPRQKALRPVLVSLIDERRVDIRQRFLEIFHQFFHRRSRLDRFDGARH